MIQYEGLCLGGPFDGERHVCDSQRMETYEREEPYSLSKFMAGELPSTMPTVKRVQYVHQWFKADGKDFGFWVLVDYLQRPRDVGPRDVVERLIENYRPVKKWQGLDTVQVDGKRNVIHPV